MKKRVWKVTNLLLGSIVTALGFGACSHHEIEDIRIEYGSPHATYRVKGTVTDSEGKPVNGIKAKVIADYSQYGDVLGVDSVYTDKQGAFATHEFDAAAMGEVGDIFKLVLLDEDGEANGAFANDTLRLKDYPRKQYAERPKDDHWSDGSYEITVDATLKQKEE